MINKITSSSCRLLNLLGQAVAMYTHRNPMLARPEDESHKKVVYNPKAKSIEAGNPEWVREQRSGGGSSPEKPEQPRSMV